MNPNEERYELLSEPDTRGYVSVRRVSDGKMAFAKVSWFKVVPRTGDFSFTGCQGHAYKMISGGCREVME